ncbi:hypothetical protein KCU78_g6065, partial [Aureobasidium melanogenum]
MHQDMPMESSRVKLLLKLSNLGSTFYPILFAAVVGRALKSIAFWKLEKGGRIGALDQVLGSMTIVQTVFTQLQMRSLSFLSLLLISIWSLSPLGGQASLRIIDTTIKPTNTTRLLQYVNTSSLLLDEIYEGADTASQFVPVNASFNIETSYWALSCPVFGDLGNGLNATGYPDPAAEAKLDAEAEPFEDPLGMSAYNTSTFSGNLFLYSANMHNFSEPWDSQVNSRLRHITYTESNNAPATWVAANCTISTTYVEVSMDCSTGSCTAAAMRKSREPCSPESWTSFDVAGTAFYWFSTPFIDALVAGHPDAATPYQKFIINPDDPFNISLGTPPVTVVSNSTFALRLGQLFNTY